ncbi:MAG: nucleotide exchange factor GrpE [Planctomycetes bacterium RBG_13_46_10]|nr:MAG: nucleotide exchange factor GrpE [Planctomycetes bacterium RBG_13_46_10]
MRHKEKPKEPTGSEPVEPAAKSVEPEKTHPAIEQLQKEKDELFGKLQRVSADYINFQKRAAKQTADTIAYEKERIIKTLLPALDNFEHMLQNAQSAENADVLLKGIRIIYDQIIDILKSHGVERIDALGAKFDPALHEAIVQKADPETEENAVLEELQKGYKLNGRVLRPSRVIVNKLPSEQEVPYEQIEQEPTDDESTDEE